MNVITKYGFTTTNTLPISISATEDGKFAASCLYSEDVRMLKVPGEEGSFVIHRKEVIGDSEDAAKEQLITVLKRTFAPL